MVAQFSDQRALLLAVNDLKASGVPDSSLRTQFDQACDMTQVAKHKGFWHRLREQRNARRQRTITGAALRVDSSCNRADVLTTLILAEGKLAHADALRGQRVPAAGSAQRNPIS